MSYKILMPIEERTYAKAQTDFLSTHKIPADAELILLAVIKPVVIQDYGYAIPHNFFENLAMEEEKWTKELLLESEKELKKHFPDLKIEKHIEFDGPAQEILRIAKEQGVNWIIIGSHGRTGLDKFFLGSVSQAVVNRAPCSVTVVRLDHAPGAEVKPQSQSDTVSKS